MQTARSTERVSGRQTSEQEAEDLTDYCSRPNCRKEFRRTVGPGRRQAYCSEICRRTAEKELRRLRTRLAHYEGLVRRLRIDVAAHGKPDVIGAPDEEMPLSLEARQTAENAVIRVGGVLAFADRNDPAVRELRLLYDAVAPVVVADVMAG